MFTILGVNIAGILLIILIVWWFWLSEPKQIQRAKGDTIDIVVDGGVYQPSTIEANPGQRLQLRFHRKDPNACAEYVIFNELGISEQLPVDRPHTVNLELPNRQGQYEFSCQMGMYRGQINVQAQQ